MLKTEAIGLNTLERLKSRNQDVHRQFLIIPQGKWVGDKIDDYKENPA